LAAPLENISHVKNIVAKHFCDASVQISRVPEGNSTFVYRVVTAHETFYLRVLPEVGASFAPEVEVHRRLRSLGAKVPEVVYFEACNELLQRSIVITTEIKGRPISQSQELAYGDMQRVVTAAGRDLALVNSLGVDGFGWVMRGEGEADHLKGEKVSYRDFVLESWGGDVEYLREHELTLTEANEIEQLVVRYDAWLDAGKGTLAHGDFDCTHIYQEDGQYTGIIDFGEIRGADHWYDVGHFHLRDGEQLPYKLEPAVMRGYGEVVGLAEDYLERVRFARMLINVRSLVGALRKGRVDKYIRRQYEVLRADLRELGR
jgi:aminoglycoside phosphotransferase (APT) family kinase protein